MNSYILINSSVEDNRWWAELIRTCAVLGDIFEIHCWADEKDAAALAMRYGRKITSSWRDGTVIMGTVTKEFLNALAEIPMPAEQSPYHKMTPFFTIRLGATVSSEHYGSEIILSKIPKEKEITVDRILKKLEGCATVHRNIRCYTSF